MVFGQITIEQLKRWYTEAEDIWNYRANISEEQKIKIAKYNVAFRLPTNVVRYMKDKKSVEEQVLSQIDILINSADDVNDRKLGCMYVLIAFTSVSYSARNALSWLL